MYLISFSPEKCQMLILTIRLYSVGAYVGKRESSGIGMLIFGTHHFQSY